MRYLFLLLLTVALSGADRLCGTVPAEWMLRGTLTHQLIMQPGERPAPGLDQFTEMQYSMDVSMVGTLLMVVDQPVQMRNIRISQQAGGASLVAETGTDLIIVGPPIGNGQRLLMVIVPQTGVRTVYLWTDR